MRNTNEKNLKFKDDPFYLSYNDSEYIESLDNRKLVVVEENSRKYTLNNDLKKELIVYRIDNGIIKSNENKCDFGIYSEDAVLILIELKGKDYDHACKQITATIDSLEIDKHVKIYARIVLSKGKTPQLRSSIETVLKKKIASRGLKSSSIAMEENLSKFYEV